MQLPSAQVFRIPHTIPEEEQTDYCLSIIGKYRNELIPLRRKAAYVEKREGFLKREIRRWKEKYSEIKKERDKLKKENGTLKKEIEKLTKTNNRYRISLFDHGNFSKKDKKNKKKKGGQLDHKDTNREAKENYKLYSKKRLFFKRCPCCNKPIKRVRATRQKILIDIIINPEVVKLLLQSERQWCSSCKKEVNAKSPQSLPFTEYGLNVFMIVLLLRFKCNLPFEKIVQVLHFGFGLKISKSQVSNILKQAKVYLTEKYEELKKAVRAGQIMYNDETGWLVRGKKAWLWIMANDKATVYFAAESRGKGIFEEMYKTSQAFSMHDGYTAYKKTIPKNKQMYCWAHFLRFVHEETYKQKRTSVGIKLKEELVKIYRLIEKRKDYTEEKFKAIIEKGFNKILSIKSKELSAKNIQHRLKEQKQGLANALLYSPDGTNNLAERELRPMVCGRKISNGSDTFTGMETRAVLASVIQTLHRQEDLPFLPTLQKYIQQGIKRKYSNFAFSLSE